MTKKKLFRRGAACLMALSLSVASFPAVAMADEALAQAFTETMEAGKDDFIAGYDQTIGMIPALADQIGSNFGVNIAASEDTAPSKCKIQLTIDEGGKSLVGSMGLDVSWLQNITLDLTGVSQGELIYVPGEITLNDGHIANVEILVDTKEMKMYLSVPDAAEGYLLVDLNEMMQQSGASLDTTQMDQVKDLLKSLPEFMPDGTTVYNLLTKYGAMALKHLELSSQEGSTISASGISETVSVSTVSLNSIGLVELVKEAVPELKADADLKTVIEKAAPLFGADANAYTEFVNKLTEFEGQLAEADTSQMTGDEFSAAVNVFNNEAGEVRGIDLVANMNGSQYYVDIFAPQANGEQGFLLNVVGEGLNFKIEGKGTNADGNFSGNYTISANDISYVDLAIETSATGFSATIKVSDSYAAPTDENGYSSYDSLGMLKGYSLVITGSAEGESSNVAISVATSGVSLFTLTISGEPVAEAIEVPAIESLAPIYDINNSEDMNNFAANLNIQALMENITNAGVPQSFIDQISQMMGGSSAQTAPVQEGDAAPVEEAPVQEGDAAAEEAPAEEPAA